MRRLVMVMGVLALGVSAVVAQDTAAPTPPVREDWATSEGNLTLQVLPNSFQGVYDQDNGRMIATLGDGVWNGLWGEDSSSEECDTVVLGTRFWGKIAFTFNADRTHFDGKWSYCDGDMASDWTGDKAP